MPGLQLLPLLVTKGKPTGGGGGRGYPLPLPPTQTKNWN